MVRYSTRLSLYQRPAADGSLPIRLRVCWCAHRVDVSTGLSAPSPSCWDEAAGAFVASFRTPAGVPAVVLNRQLRSIVVTVDEVFARFDIEQHRPPSVVELRQGVDVALGRAVPAAVEPVPVEPAVYEVLHHFVSVMGTQNGWTAGTIQKFRTLELHLREVDPAGVLVLSAMDEAWLQMYMAHLGGKAGLRNTSLLKSLDILRWFLRWAAQHGYPVPSDFERFRPHLKGTEAGSRQVVYLEWDELMAVWSVDLSASPHLARVRDVFCFCCFSGLRYSDVAHLRRSDIYADHFRVVTKKTADALRVELNGWTREVLSRYADQPLAGGLALPVISNVKMNVYLKEVGQMAGLDTPCRVVFFRGALRIEEEVKKWELLTTHCARRTFVVNALRLGIPAEVIMKWTGHSSFSAMRPYVAIVDELKAESMARFDNMPKPDAGGSSSGSGASP